MNVNMRTCYNNACSVADLSLAVACDASVVANVLGLDHRDPQLGAGIYDPDGRRDINRVRVFVPEYFRRWRAFRLAV